LIVGAILWRNSQASGSFSVEYKVAPVALTQAQVANIALGLIDKMKAEHDTGVAPRIDSMVVLRLSDLPSVTRSAGAPDAGSPDAQSIVWFVRAHGTFVGLHTPPGIQPAVASTGYFIIDDASGTVVGMGLP
jgi:hypothetical protein